MSIRSPGSKILDKSLAFFSQACVMELEIVDEPNYSEATTWVVDAQHLKIPYYKKAYEAANLCNVAVGVHVASRKIILQFDEKKTSQQAGRAFETILGKGGSTDHCIQGRAVLDFFHSESLGLYLLKPHWKFEKRNQIVEGDCFFPDPDAGGDVQYEEDLEEAELVEDEVLPPTTEDVAVQADIFALAMVSKPKVVRVPTYLEALEADTPEYTDLIAALAAGGPIDLNLAKNLMPKDEEYIKAGKDLARSMVSRKVVADMIFWISFTPKTLRVHRFVNMSTERRVQWVVWKAAKLGIPLLCTTFASLFKRDSHFKTLAITKLAYLHAMKLWTGGAFDWKKLPTTTRKEILERLLGDDHDFLCFVCNNVKKPDKNMFCDIHCARQLCYFCWNYWDQETAVDENATEKLRKRLGNKQALTKLADTLDYVDDFEKYYECRYDRPALYQSVFGDRNRETCCTKRVKLEHNQLEQAHAESRCTECVNEKTYFDKLEYYAEAVERKIFSIAHARTAERQLALMECIPCVQTAKNYCHQCEHWQ